MYNYNERNRKKKVGKKYNVATKSSLTDKPSSSELDVSTCNINNKAYERIECKYYHTYTTEINKQIIVMILVLLYTIHNGTTAPCK